jgi:tripartite-type tricarboxylate transporter receptor subunit TctC
VCGPKRTPDEVVKKLYEVVEKARKEEDFRNKTRNLDLQVAYEDPASFEKSVIQLKERLHAFFAEEGMVK